MTPGYRERYQLLKGTDEQRNKLLEELLDANDSLKKNLEKTTHRLERDNDTVELYQQRSKEAIAKFEVLQKHSNTNMYACVLVDGEDIFFKDRLVKSARLGGQDAAQLLREAVKEYIGQLGIRQDLEIVLYMYANVNALVRKYREVQLLREQGDFDRFIGGFNISYPLFNFIDAGNAQGVVKSKIGGLLRLHTRNLHCKLVVLGTSTYDGYASFLESCVGDKALENRIALLEGPPFSQELSRFSSRFKTTSFPQVFRSTKMQLTNQSDATQDRQEFHFHDKETANHKAREDKILEHSKDYRARHSSNGALNLDAEEQQTSAENGRKSSLRDNTGENQVISKNGYTPSDRKLALSDRTHHDDGTEATTAGRVSGSSKIAYPPDYFKDAPFGFVARNRKGQRVDVPLTKSDPGMISEIKQRKLCNDYCFQGKCWNRPCRHEHPKYLSRLEYHVLREVARSFPCPTGLHCNDKLCYWGHRCPVDPCGFVHDRICRYPPELHETDTGIVNKEDLQKFKNSSDEETRVFGVTSVLVKESTNPILTPRSGEPMYQDLSEALDNAAKNAPVRVSSNQKPNVNGQDLPQTSSAVGKKVPNISTARTIASTESSTDSTPAAIPIGRVPAAGDSTSPLKRTADEAAHGSKISISLARDPRVGAQKRLRELSP